MSNIFEKKEGEELTKGGTGTRHPLPSDAIVTRGPRWSSSSSETTIGGPMGLFSSGGTMTRGAGTVIGGAPVRLECPLPLARVGGGPMGL
jgi:hypothetical protein